MKKIGKKYGLVLGAIVITLLMISSATATNLLISKKISLNQEKNDVYIDPNIHLTWFHLPLLKNALKSVDDPEIQIILDGIITLLKYTNIVDKNDINKIITTNNIQKAKVYFLASITTEGGEWGHYSGGYLYCVPGNFRSLLFSYICKGGLAYWHACKTDDGVTHHVYPYVKINGDLFDLEHRGLAIGLFGICSKNICYSPGTFYMFDISGIALMVIII